MTDEIIVFESCLTGVGPTVYGKPVALIENVVHRLKPQIRQVSGIYSMNFHFCIPWLFSGMIQGSPYSVSIQKRHLSAHACVPARLKSLKKY
jgi:hypothetical protein